MIYVFLSICCSVAVSILLKLFKRYEVKSLQAIFWNYIAAIVCSGLFLSIKPLTSINELPLVDFAALGFLLPFIFIFISVSVRTSGIVRTAVAQRLSLVIPVLAAFLLFGETITILKSVGLLLGFIAISCSIPWNKQTEEQKGNWWYPFIVFAGTGVIDIYFARIAQFKGLPFTSTLYYIFILAAAISLVFAVVGSIRSKTSISLKSFLFGMLLGILNFGSIVFYLKGLHLEADRPSVIFSALDIGVIAGGAIAGLWLFREKLSRLNLLAVLIAAVAIVILTFA